MKVIIYRDKETKKIVRDGGDDYERLKERGKTDCGHYVRGAITDTTQNIERKRGGANMIKTFIFVEDGSVDLDELKSSVGDDVLVIPYRQGATPPAIQQPREPISQNSCVEQLKAENFSLREQLIAITEFALEMCDEDGCAGDESVGLPSCEMWKDYEDERGCVCYDCVLKRILAEKKGVHNG